MRRKLRIWSHLLKKSLMENFIFCTVLWCNKKKTFQRAGGKDSFKVTNNTYVCEFHITDINVSVERHVKTLKPNVVP